MGIDERFWESSRRRTWFQIPHSGVPGSNFRLRMIPPKHGRHWISRRRKGFRRNLKCRRSVGWPNWSVVYLLWSFGHGKLLPDCFQAMLRWFCRSRWNQAPLCTQVFSEGRRSDWWLMFQCKVGMVPLLKMFWKRFCYLTWAQTVAVVDLQNVVWMSPTLSLMIEMALVCFCPGFVNTSVGCESNCWNCSPTEFSSTVNQFENQAVFRINVCLNDNKLPIKAIFRINVCLQ